MCSLFKHSEVLGMWPDALLQRLSAQSTVLRFRAGEIVVHRREPSTCALLLLSGTCDVVDGDDARRRKGVRGADVSRQFRAPFVLCDVAAFNNVPHTSYVLSVSSCEFVCAPRNVLVAMVSSLSQATTRTLLNFVLRRRQETMPSTLPMTEARIRLSLLFRSVSAEFVSAMIPRLIPRVIPVGGILYEAGRLCTEMYFIRRGVVKLQDCESDTSGQTVRDGVCLGERELVFREKFACTAIALANLEVYILKHDDFCALVSTFDDEKKEIYRAASARKEVDLYQMHLHGAGMLGSCVAHIPVFGQFASPEMITALQYRFTPRVLNAGEFIVSSTEACDRLIIITRGTAVVRDGRANPFVVEKGECIGYTCLLCHRWLHSVVAVEPVDLWELRREDYAECLQKFGILENVAACITRLLQPLVPTSRKFDFMEAVVKNFPNPNSFPELKTPNLHPIVQSDGRCSFIRWNKVPVHVTKRLTKTTKATVEIIDPTTDASYVSRDAASPISVVADATVGLAAPSAEVVEVATLDAEQRSLLTLSVRVETDILGNLTSPTLQPPEHLEGGGAPAVRARQRRRSTLELRSTGVPSTTALRELAHRHDERMSKMERTRMLIFSMTPPTRPKKASPPPPRADAPYVPEWARPQPPKADKPPRPCTNRSDRRCPLFFRADSSISDKLGSLLERARALAKEGP